jgi:hypothetical protein
MFSKNFHKIRSLSDPQFKFLIFLLPDPEPDPLVKGTDPAPDPSIII